jgi:glycosyltransferase involved in cell wall biosynthesis
MSINNKSISLVGHPYAPIGMGEHIRCSYRALRSVAMKPFLTDIYKLAPPGTEELQEFSGACTDQPSDINIFHINGDEVEQSLAHLSSNNHRGGYNIIYPAWELARYPEEWAVHLDGFDEIWAPSQFIKESIDVACDKPVIHMPLACEVMLSSLLSRRYFDIPEADYVFLFFFDVRSYVTRKNPHGVIEAFHRLLESKPYSKTRLILKVNGAEKAPEVMQELNANLKGIANNVTILGQLMSDNEVKNLVRCCDCFISLHRSEGYGRGIAEAMTLGKPVIATGFSGNMDFMNQEVSFPVKYSLIPLISGEYPYYENQVWADPDIEDATNYMVNLIDSPRLGRAVGNKAYLHMKKNFSYGAIGLAYRMRLEKICEVI